MSIITDINFDINPVMHWYDEKVSKKVLQSIREVEFLELA